MATVQKADRTRPRDFHRYDRGPHFRERVACDRRPITKARAREAVECGRVEENPVDRPFDEWRFRHDVDGLEVVVVAGESEVPGVDLRIITAFVDVEDPSTAWVSSSWSNDEINVAAMLQCLNAGFRDAVDGMNPYRIDVDDPVPYHGHVLVWNDGHSDPFCLACHHTAVDGDVFERRPCYE